MGQSAGRMVQRAWALEKRRGAIGDVGYEMGDRGYGIGDVGYEMRESAERPSGIASDSVGKRSANRRLHRSSPER